MSFAPLPLLLLVLAGTSEVLQFEIGELERSALVWTPSVRVAADGAPLVFFFHGRGGNARKRSERIGLQKYWPEAVVVYPQGEPGIPGLTDPKGSRPGWQLRPGDAGDRDVRFFDIMLKDMLSRYPIDERRIFAVGHSNGGRFAAILWAMRGDLFAAVVSSGGQGGPVLKQAKPKPVMMIMGEKDRIVPFRSQQFSLRRVRKLLGADGVSAEQDGFLTTERGHKGYELVTYIHPGGHRWVDEATPHIIAFLKRQILVSSEN